MARTLICCLALLLAYNAKAQSGQGFYSQVRYTHAWATRLQRHVRTPDLHYTELWPTKQLRENSLRALVGYYINPKMAIGLGFGLDGLAQPTWNTAPLFLNGKYWLWQRENGLYADVNLGALLPMSILFDPGVHADAGIGYKLKWGNRFSFTIQAGYDFKYISRDRKSFATTERYELGLWYVSFGCMFD